MHKTYSEIIAARFNEMRAASAANGGTALTSTAGLISLPFGSEWVSLTARNFVGAAVAKFVLNPYLVIIQTADALVANFTEHSDELQDGDATDVAFDSFDVAANKNFLYVGAELPFRGAAVDIGTSAQGAASVLTVNYWNGGAWLTTAVTDGTASAGATMAIDGNVTWAVPAAWARASLIAIGDTALKTSWSMANLYWTRWQVSVITDSDWDLSQLRALNRSTAYAELIENQTLEAAVFVQGPGGVACVEALTNAGTANLVVNVAVGRGGRFV